MAPAAPLVTAPPDFALPPVRHNGEGRLRGVGVEVEFVGPTALEVAQAITATLGGNIVEEDPHAFAVRSSSVGDLTVSLDSRIMHPQKRPTLLGGVIPKIAAWFGTAASYIVPCELVTAPIPIDRLAEVDGIIDVLRQLKAKGTQDGALYAFGLHFNPEIPRQEVETATAFLKSFVLLNGWLRRQVAPDMTRHLLGFADPFPPAYARRLVAPDYWPALPAFIDDYLAFNPTRNRDLDLLPLLLHFDEARVRAVLPNEKINGRPAFHYRLPDSRVSDPGWSIGPDWNRWVVVERLAGDRARLDMVGAAFLSFEGEDKSWADRAERIAVA
jgi:hypothetical protein